MRLGISTLDSYGDEKMKNKALLVSVFLLALGLIFQPLSRATAGYPTNKEIAPALSHQPDLVVTDVSSDDLDGGKITVTVKNQGDILAQRSVLVLRFPGLGQSKTKTTGTPPLNAGQTIKVVVETQMLLSQVRYCAYADGTFKIKESNERNNERCGRFGGKP